MFEPERESEILSSGSTAALLSGQPGDQWPPASQRLLTYDDINASTSQTTTQT